MRKERQNINMTDAPITTPLRKQTQNTESDNKTRTGIYEEEGKVTRAGQESRNGMQGVEEQEQEQEGTDEESGSRMRRRRRRRRRRKRR